MRQSIDKQDRYPMPTVALINGHAFAAGMMTAMYHDYRVFNPTRGFLCINELEFGAPLKPPMSSIFRQKLPSPHTYRHLVLEARRFGGQEALDAGLVDALGGLDDALALIAARKLSLMGRTGVYGVLKREMWRESIAYLETHDASEAKDEQDYQQEMARIEVGRQRVASWDKQSKSEKAKL